MSVIEGWGEGWDMLYIYIDRGVDDIERQRRGMGHHRSRHSLIIYRGMGHVIGGERGGMHRPMRSKLRNVHFLL